MIISKIRNAFNNLTPGMTFKKYAKHVLYKGQDCGYVEEAGKRKYVLTPVIEKLEHKLDLNDFHPGKPRYITPQEFQMFKTLLKPIVRNEKGLKEMNISGKDLYYSPSPASILIWDKQKLDPIITIIKKMESPTKELFLHRYDIFRRWFRISPFK